MGSQSIIARYFIQRIGFSAPLLFYLLIISSLIQSTTAAVTKNNCKKVGVEELIDEEGCDLMIIRINRCSGHCFSFTFPNPLTKKVSVHAKCCRMVEWEMLNTKLKCGEGTRELRIPSATQCECFDCAVQ